MGGVRDVSVARLPVSIVTLRHLSIVLTRSLIEMGESINFTSPLYLSNLLVISYNFVVND